MGKGVFLAEGASRAVPLGRMGFGSFRDYSREKCQGLWDIGRKVRQVMRWERLAEEDHRTLFCGQWRVMEGFQDGWKVSI